MTYTQSIRTINIAAARYAVLCEQAATDDEIGAVLDILRRAKEQHRALFGSLRRIDGEWV